MKQIASIIMFGLVAIVLSACGGGGSNHSKTVPTPTATPAPTSTPTPSPSYVQLKDLEFKALEFHRNWKSGTTTSKTFEFSNTYLENTGIYTLLKDERSGNDNISACMMSVKGLSETYLCLSVTSHGSATAYGMSIDDHGNISGIFDYSIDGNTYELADGLYYDWLNDGSVSGKAVLFNKQIKTTYFQNRSMDDDLVISKESDTTNNIILQKTIDDVYYILLDQL